jgi:hypothetical protein
MCLLSNLANIESAPQSERYSGHFNFMKREIQISPTRDKRSSDPSKNYGIHGAEMRFILTGNKGAITFTIFTHWHLPHVDEKLRNKYQHSSEHDFMFRLDGADISYHSYIPRYEGQTDSGRPCMYLNNKPCYCDGSLLAARPICEKLIAEGSDAVWKELEHWYNKKLA